MKEYTEMKSKPIIEDYLNLMFKLYSAEASKEQFEQMRAKIFALVDACPEDAQVDIRISAQYRLGRVAGKKAVVNRKNPVSIKTFIKHGMVVPDDVTFLSIIGKPFIKLANGTKLIVSKGNETLFEEKIIVCDTDEIIGKYPNLEKDESIKAFTIEDIEDFSNIIKVDHEKKFEL